MPDHSPHNLDIHEEKHSKGQIEKPKTHIEPHVASVKHPPHEKPSAEEVKKENPEGE